MAYSELIKSFHRIRPYMRSFYVYGFRHRTEHDEKSARSYDNERRRIESWLGDYLKFGQDSDGKRVFLSMDSRAVTENPLYRAFRAKSFTDGDIMLHFLLLDMLDTREGLTMSEVMDELEGYLCGFEDIALPDESSVRKKLAEYEKQGLVRKEKQGKLVRYYLPENELALDAWTDAVAFFSEAAPLGVIGSYLREGSPSRFRFKHHYILNALDSEILYPLFLAMGEAQTVLLQEGKVKTEILPLRIYISTQSGRQYVLGRTLRGFRFFRLDLIDSVTPGGPAEISAELLSDLAQFQSKVWGTAIRRGTQTKHLEMVVHAEPEEYFIPQRLLREKRVGTVTELGEGNWLFSADVFDAVEMLPWIRTFIGRIVSLRSDDPEVEKRFREDMQAMNTLYGGDAHAVF